MRAQIGIGDTVFCVQRPDADGNTFHPYAVIEGTLQKFDEGYAIEVVAPAELREAVSIALPLRFVIACDGPARLLSRKEQYAIWEKLGFRLALTSAKIVS